MRLRGQRDDGQRLAGAFGVQQRLLGADEGLLGGGGLKQVPGVVSQHRVGASVGELCSPLMMCSSSGTTSLSLDEAAVLAEFEAAGDSETVTALVAAAKTGQFAHVAQRARDDRAAQTREQAARDTIPANGIKVLDGRPPARYTAAVGDAPERLVSHLADADGHSLTPAGHAACLGHEWGRMTAEQAATVRLADSSDAEDDAGDHGVTDDAEDDDAEGDDTGDDAPGVAWRSRYAAVYVCRDYAARDHRCAGRRTERLSPVTRHRPEAAKEAAWAERRT